MIPLLREIESREKPHTTPFNIRPIVLMVVNTVDQYNQYNQYNMRWRGPVGGVTDAPAPKGRPYITA